MSELNVFMKTTKERYEESFPGISIRIDGNTTPDKSCEESLRRAIHKCHHNRHLFSNEQSEYLEWLYDEIQSPCMTVESAPIMQNC